MKQKYEQKVGLGAQGWVLGGHISAGCWLWGLRGNGAGRFGGCLHLFSPVWVLPGQRPHSLWQVTDLHQELAEARRAVTELESEREQKQRDFDRKLLLAKSRIETEEVSPLGRGTRRCQACCPALADLPPPWSCRQRRRGWPWR